MKVIKSLKFAQTFNELYDHVDDDTVETLDQYEHNDDNYDSLEMGEIPITDDNVDSVLVDNLINEYGEEEGGGDVLTEEFPLEEVPTEEFPLEEVPIEEVPTVVEPIKEVPTEEEAQEQDAPAAQESIPDPEDDAKKHFGSNIRGALEWAKEKKRVVQIFYNTEGRKRGVGGKKYLKRELNLPKMDGGGVNINRIIEPHYFFHAKTTKRDILVTYDRSVRHVRAFVVDNITDYNFTKKRGTDEDQYFGRTNRPGIKEPIKGIDKMKNVNDKLTEMEAKLKTKGLVKSASVVENVGKVLKSIKTAQYVGVQGYWIRNRRCWDNCYRQKRTTQPETPAQEVWMQCWDEYREAINNPKSGWEKYAKKNKNIKISTKKENQLNKLFASDVSKKVKKGMSTPEAVYTIIEKETDVQKDKILESSSQLMELADILNSNGMKDLGEKLAGISAEVLKEADFTGSKGGFLSPFQRGGEWLADKWTGRGGKSDVVKKMQSVIERANMLLRMLNASQKVQVNSTKPQAQAGSKSIVIEAGKGAKIVEAQATINPQQMARQKANRENKQRGQDLMDARFEDQRNQKLMGDPQDAGNIGAPPEESKSPVINGPNGVADGGEDKNKNNIADGQEDNNQNNTPDGQEDNNQNNTPDGQEDNTGAAETTDQNQDGLDDTTGQPTQKEGPNEKAQLEYVKNNFGKFMNDVSSLIKEFTGLAAQGNEEVKNYATQANPLLQKFINNGNKLFSEADNNAKIQILRSSLEGLISGLQGVVSGQGPSLDLGFGAGNTGGAGAGSPGAGSPGAGAGLPGAGAGAGAGNNLVDINNLGQLDDITLNNLKKNVDETVDFRKYKNRAAASYNHKLKIMK